MGVLFWNQPHHPFLSDPCPLLAGPHTGTGAGRHGLSPPFPPAPPLQAPKGQPPLRTPARLAVLIAFAAGMPEAPRYP